MDFIAKEDVVLALVSPAGIGVRVMPLMMAISFAVAGLLTKFTGMSPKMCGIYSSITPWIILRAIA
jgi:hypothetical protein